MTRCEEEIQQSNSLRSAAEKTLKRKETYHRSEAHTASSKVDVCHLLPYPPIVYVSLHSLRWMKCLDRIKDEVAEWIVMR